MRLFVFEDFPAVSTLWHSEGGLVILAKDTKEAARLARDHAYANRLPMEENDPRLIGREIDLAKRQVLAFPNAGCC